MLKPELEDESYGSSFDPVLNGVAHGLARLFPPVHNIRGSERDEDAPQHDACIYESEATGSHRRS